MTKYNVAGKIFGFVNKGLKHMRDNNVNKIESLSLKNAINEEDIHECHMISMPCPRNDIVGYDEINNVAYDGQLFGLKF